MRRSVYIWPSASLGSVQPVSQSETIFSQPRLVFQSETMKWRITNSRRDPHITHNIPDKDPTKSSCIIREHLILWQPSWELSFRTLFRYYTTPSAVLNMSHQFWPPVVRVTQVLRLFIGPKVVGLVKKHAFKK